MGSDWYFAIDGTPNGPVSADELSALVFKRQISANDLVWCEGLAGWTPVASVLGASERPAPRSPTHTVHVEAAERREAAHRVVSLSRLYVEQLAERTLVPIPHPSSSFIVTAHDSAGYYPDALDTQAYPQPSLEQASARYVVEPPQRGAGSWQPELAELTRLVEVSEAGADWNTEMGAHNTGSALVQTRHG